MTDLDPRSVPMVPVSWGELLDKITILEIKHERIVDAGARRNVAVELALLRDVAAAVSDLPEIVPLVDELRRVNIALWEIEDDIRHKEVVSEFDESFIALARAVYRTNDQRSALKRDINTRLGSSLVEEKQHLA